MSAPQNDESWEDITIRCTVLVSGVLSVLGSSILLMLLVWWLRKLCIIAATGCDVSVRTILCHFMLHLAICDFFAGNTSFQLLISIHRFLNETGLSYIASFFIRTYDTKWFCIIQAGLMLIFEQGSVFWTASLAFLFWRISIIYEPQEVHSYFVFARSQSPSTHKKVGKRRVGPRSLRAQKNRGHLYHHFLGRAIFSGSCHCGD
jgi:hypothetical protein